MEEEIKKFKEMNGNNNFTAKELTMYVIQKHDKFEENVYEKLEEIGTLQATNKANIKNVKNGLLYGLIIGVPVVGTILGWIIIQIFRYH